MGDASDMSDIDRFLRSSEGRAHLDGIRQSLEGRTVVEVHFTNQAHYVGVGLALDNGNVFECPFPELDVDTLRDDFEEVLEREYYKDYPERQPK